MAELNERQREIVELIKQSGLQSINDLAARFDVTTQTIRRDINALCDEGLARRVHGGVVPPSNPVNLNFRARQILNEADKRDIGQQTARLIPSGASVLLGIGTTVQYVAEALVDHADMTIVTNNLEVASILCNAASAEVHVVGGVLRSDDRDVVGGATLRGFARFVADCCVIGAGALDPHHGLLDFKPIDADICDVILSQARKRILVADHSKWAKNAKNRVAGFERIDTLVTDRLPPAAAVELQAAHPDLQVIECGHPDLSMASA